MLPSSVLATCELCHVHSPTSNSLSIESKPSSLHHLLRSPASGCKRVSDLGVFVNCNYIQHYQGPNLLPTYLGNPALLQTNTVHASIFVTDWNRPGQLASLISQCASHTSQGSSSCRRCWLGCHSSYHLTLVKRSFSVQWRKSVNCDQGQKDKQTCLTLPDHTCSILFLSLSDTSGCSGSQALCKQHQLHNAMLFHQSKIYSPKMWYLQLRDS